MNESVALPVGYAEHAPPADLASFVACFWTRRRDAGLTLPSSHRVLPDGCVDILLSFGSSAVGDETGDGTDELPIAMGVGPMTKPIFVAGRGPRLYVGARFNPGCAFAAFGVPASELVDDSVAFELLSADAQRELESIAGQRGDAARVNATVELVRRRLVPASVVPRSVRAAVRRILGARGNLRIAALAAEIGITRQQLARQFATHVGVTPKLLARVARTQAALARADAARATYPRGVDWSAIAYELGYYDQPHFIDDFKALTGSTPGEWSTTSRPFFGPEPTP